MLPVALRTCSADSVATSQISLIHQTCEDSLISAATCGPQTQQLAASRTGLHWTRESVALRRTSTHWCFVVNCPFDRPKEYIQMLSLAAIDHDSSALYIGLALIALVCILMILAILKYRTVDEALKLWGALGAIAGVIGGSMGTFFFTRDATHAAITSAGQAVAVADKAASDAVTEKQSALAANAKSVQALAVADRATNAAIAEKQAAIAARVTAEQTLAATQKSVEEANQQLAAAQFATPVFRDLANISDGSANTMFSPRIETAVFNSILQVKDEDTRKKLLLDLNEALRETDDKKRLALIQKVASEIEAARKSSDGAEGKKEGTTNVAPK
jgi:hypothetical protein